MTDRKTYRYIVCLAVLICLCVTSVSSTACPSPQKDNLPSAQYTLHGRAFANQNDTGSHGSGGQTGTIDKITTAQGVTREYELYIPSSVGTKPGPFPLFIYLHGAGGDKTQGTSRFGNRSNSDGFIIASPSGDYQKSWREIYTTDGSTQTYYDSSLIRVILNETIPLYNIDLSNTWIGGYSDRGAMSLRAGTLMSDIFATVTHQTGGWKEDWANASWIVRKSMSFYSAVGDGDFGFRQHLEDAHDYFVKAGFEHKLEIIQNTWHEWRDDNQNLFADWEKNHFLPHDWIHPAISFNQPMPGAQWDVGSKQTVEWWLGCGNPSYQVKLELSTSGPTGPWTLVDTINQSTWGMNQYDWNIPGSTPATTQAVLRATITDSSSPQRTGVSQMNYTFKIVSQSNLPPVVNAGPDQTIQLGSMAYLNGTTTDPENDPLTITWIKQSGPGTVTFADPKVAKTTALFSTEGDYVLALEATDGMHSAVSDAVSVKVTPAPVVNHPPSLASIGDKSVAEGEHLAFTVQATDPDKDALTYSAAGAPKNSAFETSTGKFTFDPDHNQSGVYPATFAVSDGKGGSDTVSIKITVTDVNRAPTAKAGSDREVKVGELVTLTGDASTDPDGDALTYEWKQVSGPQTTLSGSTTATPTFTPQKAGTYVFQLVVRDLEAHSSSAKVTITAKGDGGGGQTTQPSKSSDWFPGGTLGFAGLVAGIAVAIVIILALLMLRRRRPQQVWQSGQGDAYWNAQQNGYQQPYDPNDELFGQQQQF